MAAPETMTTLDISGKYIMNKKLSDDTDEILRLQGVGWWTRLAISNATIYLDVRHYKDEQAVEHIDIVQTLSGGFGGTTEVRTLDWEERPHEDKIFGSVIGKSRRVSLTETEIPEEFLRNGWTDDVQKHHTIHGIVVSAGTDKTWRAEQTWGFEVIDGTRYYVRHVFFTGPEKEVIKARLVYDYTGPRD